MSSRAPNSPTPPAPSRLRFVTRGDWSQPLNCARATLTFCAQHGPNPMSQPAFLRSTARGGALRHSRDRPACGHAHKVTRKIIDGPKVTGHRRVGHRLYCVAEASPRRLQRDRHRHAPVGPGQPYMNRDARGRATIALLARDARRDRARHDPRRRAKPGAAAPREDIARAVAQPATTRRDLAAMDARRRSPRPPRSARSRRPGARGRRRDIEIQVGRCGPSASLGGPLIAARRRGALAEGRAQTRAWKLVGQRAEAIGRRASTCADKAPARHAPRDGPDGGGQSRACAAARADAQGSAAEAAPAQGAPAMVPRVVHRLRCDGGPRRDLRAPARGRALRPQAPRGPPARRRARAPGAALPAPELGPARRRGHHEEAPGAWSRRDRAGPWSACLRPARRSRRGARSDHHEGRARRRTWRGDGRRHGSTGTRKKDARKIAVMPADRSRLRSRRAPQPLPRVQVPVSAAPRARASRRSTTRATAITARAGRRARRDRALDVRVRGVRSARSPASPRSASAGWWLYETPAPVAVLRHPPARGARAGRRCARRDQRRQRR